MRSLLFVPGDSPRKLEKGFASEADIVIIDLEDSVAPQNKALARATAADFLKQRRSGQSPRARSPLAYVRVNDLSSRLIDDDLAALVPTRPDGVMLPKSNNGADVQSLAVKLRVQEAENGLADGGIAILPIITETPAGVLAAASYAGASGRLAGLTWGAEDLSAAVGARTARDAEGRYTDVFRLARALTILAASSAGIAAIDTVFPNFRDLAALRAECLAAERDGFTGKMAIHPDQAPVINEAFTPAEDAVARARTLIETFQAAGNPGVVALDGQMFDLPHLRRAERILERARAAGIIS